MATSSPLKRNKSVSRRLPGGEYRAGLRKHAKLAGEVIWAWNELHLAYAFAFAHAVNIDRPWRGQAVWNAVTNDTTRRNALYELMRVSDLPVGNRRGMQWAIKETDKLATYRNDIVHGAMLWSIGEKGHTPSLDYFGNPFPRIYRYMARELENGEIRQPDLQKMMVHLRGDLMQLAAYVGEISRSSLDGKPQPLPRRPRLQAHAFVLLAQGKASRRRRHNPPRSSRA